MIPRAGQWSSVQNFRHHGLAPSELVEWKSLAISAEELTLLLAVRNKALCQAPLLCCHNAMSLMVSYSKHYSFWNFMLNRLSNVKTTGKYWLNFIFFTSQDENKTVLLGDMVHQTFLMESALQLLIPSQGCLVDCITSQHSFIIEIGIFQDN